MSLLYPNWWRKNFLLVESGIAMLATAALLLWCEHFGGFLILEKLVHGNRGQIYGTFASISGSLLGFVIATLSVVLGFNASRRLDILRKSEYYKQLWAVFTSSIRVLGSATLAWLVALIADRDDRPELILAVLCLGVTVLTILRLARTVWVLERIVEVLIAPGPAKQPESSQSGTLTSLEATSHPD